MNPADRSEPDYADNRSNSSRSGRRNFRSSGRYGDHAHERRHWGNEHRGYDNNRPFNDYDRGGYNRDDRNFFERTGDRIRDSWRDMSHNDEDYSRRYRRDDGRHDDDRNFFERAGDRIRDTWNNLGRHDDRDHAYSRGSRRYYDEYAYQRDNDRRYNERDARDHWPEDPMPHPRNHWNERDEYRGSDYARRRGVSYDNGDYIGNGYSRHRRYEHFGW